MKATDNIEKIILKNLEEIRETEPLEGHFERFEAKLNRQHKKKKITLNVVWKVAAAVLFVLLATNQAAIYFSPNHQGFFVADKSSSEISLGNISPEYKEVEYYYNNAINVGLEQWNSLGNEGFVSVTEQNLMNDELTEFEERYKTLQNDLAANPNDERVINAMLEYYQAKLNIINMIVNKLQEVKQQKNNSHETNI